MIKERSSVDNADHKWYTPFMTWQWLTAITAAFVLVVGFIIWCCTSSSSSSTRSAEVVQAVATAATGAASAVKSAAKSCYSAVSSRKGALMAGGLATAYAGYAALGSEGACAEGAAGETCRKRAKLKQLEETCLNDPTCAAKLKACPRGDNACTEKAARGSQWGMTWVVGALVGTAAVEGALRRWGTKIKSLKQIPAKVRSWLSEKWGGKRTKTPSPRAFPQNRPSLEDAFLASVPKLEKQRHWSPLTKDLNAKFNTERRPQKDRQRPGRPKKSSRKPHTPIPVQKPFRGNGGIRDILSELNGTSV